MNFIVFVKQRTKKISNSEILNTKYLLCLKITILFYTSLHEYIVELNIYSVNAINWINAKYLPHLNIDL